MPKAIQIEADETTWPTDKSRLLELGIERKDAFCILNQVSPPSVVEYLPDEYKFVPCAYYRPETIHICLAKCQAPAPVAQTMNWSWPASVTDREPYGVIAHELGHHCDWLAGKKKRTYYSEYSTEVMTLSGENPITSYCPNPAEWFAEIFRVFVTNPDLLSYIRPKAYAILCDRWKPLPTQGWRHELGENVPGRIVKTLVNKGAR